MRFAPQTAQKSRVEAGNLESSSRSAGTVVYLPRGGAVGRFLRAVCLPPASTAAACWGGAVNAAPLPVRFRLRLLTRHIINISAFAGGRLSSHLLAWWQRFLTPLKSLLFLSSGQRALLKSH